MLWVSVLWDNVLSHLSICACSSYPSHTSATLTHSLCSFLPFVGGPHLADDLSREYKLRFSPVYVTLGMFIPSPVISEILWKYRMWVRWKTPSMQMKRAMYCLIIIIINIYFWDVKWRRDPCSGSFSPRATSSRGEKQELVIMPLANDFNCSVRRFHIYLVWAHLCVDWLSLSPLVVLALLFRSPLPAPSAPIKF